MQYFILHAIDWLIQQKWIYNLTTKRNVKNITNTYNKNIAPMANVFPNYLAFIRYLYHRTSK